MPLRRQAKHHQQHERCECARRACNSCQALRRRAASASSLTLHPSMLQDKDSAALTKMGGVEALAKALQSDLHRGLREEGSGPDSVAAHRAGVWLKPGSLSVCCVPAGLLRGLQNANGMCWMFSRPPARALACPACTQLTEPTFCQVSSWGRWGLSLKCIARALTDTWERCHMCAQRSRRHRSFHLFTRLARTL
jgi:hypothetical protein